MCCNCGSYSLLFFVQKAIDLQHRSEAPEVSLNEHGLTAVKKVSSPLPENDILSSGTVKAHNDIRQNNTAHLTNVGTGTH